MSLLSGEHKVPSRKHSVAKAFSLDYILLCA